jgi:hypothetical protein
MSINEQYAAAHDRAFSVAASFQARIESAGGDFRSAFDTAIAERAPDGVEYGVMLFALLGVRLRGTQGG